MKTGGKVLSNHPAREKHSCLGIWFDLIGVRKHLQNIGEGEQKAFCDEVLYPYFDLVTGKYPPTNFETKVVCFGDTVYVQKLLANGGQTPSPVEVIAEIRKELLGPTTLDVYAIVAMGDVWGTQIHEAKIGTQASGRSFCSPGVSRDSYKWELGLSDPLRRIREVETAMKKCGAGIIYQEGCEDYFDPKLEPSGDMKCKLDGVFYFSAKR